jgi:hypothetical protein
LGRATQFARPAIKKEPTTNRFGKFSFPVSEYTPPLQKRTMALRRQNQKAMYVVEGKQVINSKKYFSNL